jgi:hypothetical protein
MKVRVQLLTAILMAGCADVLGYGDVVVGDPDASAAGAGGADASVPDTATDAGGSSQGGSSQGGSAGSTGAGGEAGTAGTGGSAGSSGQGGTGGATVEEPNQLVGIHFWDDAAGTDLAGPKPYYDVEAFESAVDPNTVVTWMTQREGAGARGIIRIDYQWGYSVPKTDGDRQTYATRLVAIAKAVAGAGLKTHHYIVGNESNLPGEGGASVAEVGQAYGVVHDALSAAAPWTIQPVLLSTPPSTAAQYGGGDGSYLTGVLNESKSHANVDGIAIHAYENADSGGSANLFMATVLYQAQAIQSAGLTSKPIFITEMNVDLNQAGDAAGATFVANAYSRLDSWNQGGEGNPLPASLRVEAGCWFVWHDDGNWGHLALNGSHAQTKAAFLAAFAHGYAP